MIFILEAKKSRVKEHNIAIEHFFRKLKTHFNDFRIFYEHMKVSNTCSIKHAELRFDNVLFVINKRLLPFGT